MKKLLFVTVAVSALGIIPAHAQYEKDHDRDQIMNETQTMQPESQPQQQSYHAPTTVEPQADVATYKSKQDYDFTGPYGGADIGYSISSADVEDNNNPDGDVGLSGWEGGLFLGYGMTHSFASLGAYGGLEIGYEWSGADGDIAGTNYEKKNEWLATFRPGFTVHDDVLGYGIIGYSRAKVESNGDDDNLNGLVLGAGTEFNTGSPLRVRLEYTYTNYKEGDLNDAKFEPQENDIKLGAVFRL